VSAPATYLDPLTQARFPLATPRWRSNSGAPLDISLLPGLSRDDIERSARSLWRYRAALPAPRPAPVSLGEGCTPLVASSFRGHDALFKLEWMAPTGSFKDRGSSVLVSYLKAQAVGEVLEDSSGNGGSSLAAYCARAGMRAHILVPAATQAAKVAQIRAYGAHVTLVPGSREKTAEEAIRLSRDIFYASHNWQPLFLQGTKTLAYELWEDLGFKAPDNVIIPTGAGSNVLGCDLGFGELLRAGQIARRPRLFAVQPENCAPIHFSFAAGARDIVAGAPVAPTIAEGTAIARPVRGRAVLAALRASDGASVAVSEDEITAAMRELAQLGFYVEPSSAVAAAGFHRLVEADVIAAGSTTVVLLTGSGMKATSRWQGLLAD
jgi:threonine synthase